MSSNVKFWRKGSKAETKLSGPFEATVLTVYTDGKDFRIAIESDVIPFLNIDVIKAITFCCQDALLRVRPDLRQQ